MKGVGGGLLLGYLGCASLAGRFQAALQHTHARTHTGSNSVTHTHTYTVNGTRLVQSLSLDELIILDGSDGCTPEVVSSIPVGANFGSVDFPCWFQDRTCLRLGGVELRLVVG